MTQSSQPLRRLESLDALRGFDLFCLVGLEAVMHALDRAVDAPWFDKVMWCFTHEEWEGLSPWDLVMPLFMFMAGVTIPFALSRYKSQPRRGEVWRRILKRVLLLWVFGMMCQGNLLALNPDRIYLYSNTLQAIAAGYLIAAMLYLSVGRRGQIIVAVVLLAVYWAGMEFLSAGGLGGGDYAPFCSFAEGIDRVCLGRFRDGAVWADGTVMFAPGYNYTWVWSTLTFGVTTLTGVFAGYVLKEHDLSPRRKTMWLTAGGIGMVVLGEIWGLDHPVIKRLWTGSMVLVSSGCCWLLMALFYYLIDCKGYRRHIGWLKVYGMNSIAAYMLCECINFSSVSRSLLFGLEQFAGNYYPVLITAFNALILYAILWLMYKRGVFLKV